MNVARNCGGKYPDQGFQLRVIDQVFTECPISSYDPDAVEVLGIINMCEGEFGGQRLPSTVLEETNHYHEARAIILAERGRIERLKKAREDRKGKRGKR